MKEKLTRDETKYIVDMYFIRIATGINCAEPGLKSCRYILDKNFIRIATGTNYAEPGMKSCR